MNLVKVKYCNEDLKYRVFGLFPYFAKNENGELVLYKGNTLPDGCWGQLSCSFKIDFDFPQNGDIILKSGNVYSYQTLHKLYLKYKDRKNEPFIKFMEKGIGKIRVSVNLDMEECDLVPNVVNLSECSDLYNELLNIKIITDRYLNQQEKVSTLFGDKFEDCFEIYNEEIGENYWDPIGIYEKGDIVYYDDGNTYICIGKKNIINCDLECLLSKYQRMGGDVMLEYYQNMIKKADEISEELFNLADNNTYFSININITNSYHDLGAADVYENLWTSYETYFKGDLVTYNGDTYICEGNFNKDGEDIGVIGEWDDKFWELTSVVMGKSPEENNSDIIITGKTDSKLKSFRRFENYISILNELETPDFTEDWLWYYKIGHLASYTTTRDEDSNIAVFEGTERKIEIGSTEDNLMAYGDILTNITRNTEDKTITFEYIIGAHLLACLIDKSVNEFGKPIYKYSDFIYDESDKYHGVKYIETYNYDEGGDIDEMDDYMFDKFIKNYTVYDIKDKINLDENINFNDELKLKIVDTKYIKGIFNTTSVINRTSTIINGIEHEFTYLPTDFTVTIAPERDYNNAPLIRRDYYSNLEFTPIVKNKVRFGRGNSSAWERHIKLGEVKSFDDFINYQNNGFFNVL